MKDEISVRNSAVENLKTMEPKSSSSASRGAKKKKNGGPSRVLSSPLDPAPPKASVEKVMRKGAKKKSAKSRSGKLNDTEVPLTKRKQLCTTIIAAVPISVEENRAETIEEEQEQEQDNAFAQDDHENYSDDEFENDDEPASTSITTVAGVKRAQSSIDEILKGNDISEMQKAVKEENEVALERCRNLTSKAIASQIDFEIAPPQSTKLHPKM